MRNHSIHPFFVFLTLAIASCSPEQKQPQTDTIFRYHDATTRWSSPENLNGIPGQGGQENEGAKGHAFDPIPAGTTRTLLDVKGTGVITRMWITVADRSATMLRSLRLEMYWDGATKPAVSVPFGDFFGVGLGRTTAFQNAFFANAEGRAFQSFIPMPFKTGARITVTNESAKDLSHIFFDVNFQFEKSWDADNLYFHSYWSRDTATTLTRDFELLPIVEGRGRYLGVNVGVNSNPAYGKSWWGEGEVKIWLDQDEQFPSLNGTGTEDYIGTGWGQGAFINTYAGCNVADEARNQWSFYRLHVPDPVYFHERCKVVIQQIGGNMKSEVVAMQKAGAKLIPVTVDNGGILHRIYHAGSSKSLESPDLPDGWVNFYRVDDVSATSYFYLDKPESNLPNLQPVELRVARLRID